LMRRARLYQGLNQLVLLFLKINEMRHDMCARNICFYRHPLLWCKWKYHIWKWKRFQRPDDWEKIFDGAGNHPC
jgi:hypothetical protein